MLYRFRKIDRSTEGELKGFTKESNMMSLVLGLLSAIIIVGFIVTFFFHKNIIILIETIECKHSTTNRSDKGKFGLDLYYLKRHSFYRYVNMFNETIYTFNMEWFPSHEAEPVDDDVNPDGTAVIEVNLNTGQIESVIFCHGQNLYLDDGVTFKRPYQLMSFNGSNKKQG
ncbi:hypothetical protein ACEQPO_06195 [Bacillus sp. SL00103]